MLDLVHATNVHFLLMTEIIKIVKSYTINLQWKKGTRFQPTPKSMQKIVIEKLFQKRNSE